MFPAPDAGRLAVVLAEGAVEGGLRAVADIVGDLRQAAALAQLRGGQLQSPVRQIAHRRLADQVSEVLGEGRTRQPHRARQGRHLSGRRIPALALAIPGSGDFTADKMEGETVKVKIAGSGSLKVAEVAAKTLETKIAGSGDAIISGTADNVDFSVAGSGTINAQKLTATNAEVSIAGSGDVSINATGKVEAKVAGSGDINVTGGATCTSKSMGSGNINCS